MIVLREWDIELPKKFEIDAYKLSAIDIGCGNGLFLENIAKNHPEITFFGLEKRAKYINKTKKRIEKANLSNVILINGDFLTALDKFFEIEFFDFIYINFPDPWPKKRDSKKRAITEKMIKTYHSIMKNSALLYFVTDNIEYRDYAIDLIIGSNLLKPFFDSPYFVEKLEEYPVSLYEQKWRKQGKRIYYSIFKKL